jgi:hypothetical protein
LEGADAWVFVIANDKPHAGQIKRYISGIFHASKGLRQLVENETREQIKLKTGVNISVKTSPFLTLRGYSCATVILEDVAFYRSEESANPDREIIAAVRPALANLDGLLLAISTPYARSGILYENFRKYFMQPGGPLIWKESSPRMMNPISRASVIKKEMEQDPQAARSEWSSEFREDLEQIFSLEAVSELVKEFRARKANGVRNLIQELKDESE